MDLNRNFPGGWGEGYKDFVKESIEPWTSVYKGVNRKKNSQCHLKHPYGLALSEPETKALDKHMGRIKDKTLLAISMHSYGKDIYYPKVKHGFIKKSLD